jgi:hypothetical protein
VAGFLATDFLETGFLVDGFLVADGSDERFRLIVNLGQPRCTVSLGYSGTSLLSFLCSGDSLQWVLLFCHLDGQGPNLFSGWPQSVWPSHGGFLAGMKGVIDQQPLC